MSQDVDPFSTDLNLSERQVDNLIGRLNELMALLKRLKAHVPGSCWCGETHARERV
jgi:hypothetical protein